MQQFVRRGGLHCQHQAVAAAARTVGAAGATGPASGSGGRVEGCAALTCPGLVATDFTGFQAPRTPEQGAATAIRLATLPDGGPTGSFFEDDCVIPW